MGLRLRNTSLVSSALKCLRNALSLPNQSIRELVEECLSEISLKKQTLTNQKFPSFLFRAKYSQGVMITSSSLK